MGKRRDVRGIGRLSEGSTLGCFIVRQGELDVLAGMSIDEVVRDACTIANAGYSNATHDGQPVFGFNFSGGTKPTIVQVRADSPQRAICRDVLRRVYGWTDNAVVGPYPPEELSRQVLECDKRQEEADRSWNRRHGYKFTAGSRRKSLRRYGYPMI